MEAAIEIAKEHKSWKRIQSSAPKTVMLTFSKSNLFIPRICLLGLCSFAFASGFAGIGDELGEDASEIQGDDLEWPEAAFPDPGERGHRFLAGEFYKFRAQWGIFGHAGRIEITTDETLQDNVEVFRVNLESASDGFIRKLYKLDLNATTTLDKENWTVLSDKVEGFIRSDAVQTLAEFDYENALMRYEDTRKPQNSKVKRLPYEVTLDYVSSLLELRGWDMGIGDRYQMCVNSRGKFYFVELEVKEREEIKTKFGRRECFRIEPIKVFPKSKTFREGGKMAIWITADDDRIPVRVDLSTSIGTAKMHLEEYTTPEARALAKL